MATLTIPYTFTNGSPIVASEHNSNNGAIETFVNNLSAGTGFDTGAIGTATIANASVTTAKLATSLALTTPDIGAATGTSLNTTGNVVYHLGINAQLASYTLVLLDDGKVVEVSFATANALTVPLNATVAFPIGTQITVIQTGVGQTTITATGGVTINATPGLKLRAQWSAATLIKRATNTWVAIGDLAA
jgi:hypothetical protein